MMEKSGRRIGLGTEVRVKGNKEFSFCHVNIEIPVRHPDGIVRPRAQMF